MKKAIISLFTIFSFLSFKAQDYTPFPTDSATWHQMHVSIQPNGNELTEYFFTLDGTYEANGHSYSALYNNGGLCGGIREDSLKTIWYHVIEQNCGTAYPENFIDSLEIPLYEFGNIEVGTQFDYLQLGLPYIVTDIDSVLINESYRKYYTVEDGFIGEPQYWIEGIGSTHGLFANYAINFEWVDYLLCFSDGETNYVDQFLGFNSCDASMEHMYNHQISLYPNPLIDNLYVETDSFIERFSIYSLSGELIVNGKPLNHKFPIDLNDLSPGTYILKLFNRDQMSSHTIVKL